MHQSVGASFSRLPRVLLVAGLVSQFGQSIRKGIIVRSRAAPERVGAFSELERSAHGYVRPDPLFYRSPETHMVIPFYQWGLFLALGVS